MIICDPNQLAEYSFDADKKKPPASRPAFIVKAMTAAVFRAYRNRVDEIAAIPDITEQFDAAEKLLREYIVGLRNIKQNGAAVEMTPELRFESIVSGPGYWDLLYNLGNASAPSEPDFLR